MDWFVVIGIVVVALIFVIALLLVKVQEGFDEDEMLYIESKRRIKSEYYRSLRLDRQMKDLKEGMNWHSNNN